MRTQTFYVTENWKWPQKSFIKNEFWWAPMGRGGSSVQAWWVINGGSVRKRGFGVGDTISLAPWTPRSALKAAVVHTKVCQDQCI